MPQDLSIFGDEDRAGHLLQVPEGLGELAHGVQGMGRNVLPSHFRMLSDSCPALMRW